MSIRRETVYWHGCAEEGCDSASHGCTRVELWTDAAGDEPLAYIYDEGVHCLPCTWRRFPAGPDGRARGVDTAGQPVEPLGRWDGWWDDTLPACQFLRCDGCQRLIDESHDQAACECADLEEPRLRTSA